MTDAAQDLLAVAAARGVRVRVHESGKLAVSGALDDALRDHLRTHRDELLAYLAIVPQTAPCSHCARFAFPVMYPPMICFRCRQRMGTTPNVEIETKRTQECDA